MLAEIICIGDEILIGQVVNTNATFLSKELSKIGIEVLRVTSISDNIEKIKNSLKSAMEKSDLVIITGGLGPTNDDKTKIALCEFFNDKLITNPDVLEHIIKIFKDYVKKPINELNKNQALLPSKAKILINDYGTASGMWFRKNKKNVISLPGVPFEMKHLMEKKVIPKLKKHSKFHIVNKTLLTYGLGESHIAKRIESWEKELPKNINFAYLPNLGRVRLRLSSKGINEKQIHAKIDKYIAKLLPLIKDIFVGYEEDAPVEKQIQNLFKKNNITLAIAESCTGGEIASRLTKIPGSSDYFLGSITAYNSSIKKEILGVDEQLIKTHSVVSKEVSKEMALKVREKFSSTYGVSTTGTAGPSLGDSKEKIGTVYITISKEDKIITEKFNFGNHRERIILKTVNKVFEMLIKIIH